LCALGALYSSVSNAANAGLLPLLLAAIQMPQSTPSKGREVVLREKIVGELRGVMRGLRVVTFCVPPASSQHTRMTPPAPDVSPINRDENELILWLCAAGFFSAQFITQLLAYKHMYTFILFQLHFFDSISSFENKIFFSRL
jgi:hypothetical protein